MPEVEITKRDIEQLRADARAGRSPRNEAVATVVLARAGQATTARCYRLIGGEWLSRLETTRAEWGAEEDNGS